MRKVTLSELESRAGQLQEEVEVCDQSGRVVGRFLPEHIYRQHLYEWANAQFTDSELDRAAQEPGGYTTAEVLQHLRSLEK